MSAAAPVMSLSKGVVGVRIVLYQTPFDELREAMQPPWPRWMKRLYELEQASDPEVDASEGETSIPAAVSALSNHLKHRLDIIAFVAQGLSELGFELQADGGDAIVATARARPADTRAALDRAGVAGPMCNVCELDASGWPRIFYGGDADE